jgi:hypothetical protein
MNNLDYKRKLFKERIENSFNLPLEIRNKITQSLFQDDNTYLLPLNGDGVDDEKQALIDEANEILDELEVFERHNRKVKMMVLMEKLAEQMDNDMINIDELTDFTLFGDKICNIEKRHLQNEKKSNIFNPNLVVKINKMLEDDNRIGLPIEDNNNIIDNSSNNIQRQVTKAPVVPSKPIHKNKKTCNACRVEGGRVYKCSKCKKSFHKKCHIYKYQITNNIRKKICKDCY